MKITRLLLGITTLWSTPGSCGTEATSTSAPEPGLVAYYSFDEGQGRLVKDLSGNNNNGKILGEPRWVKLTDDFGVQNFGYALEIGGGKDGIVDCGPGPTLDLPGAHLTLEAWFKTGDAKNVIQPLIHKFTTDWKTYHRGYLLSVEGNHVRLWLGFGDTAKAFIDTEHSLEPNTFYHAIVTYDGKFVKIHLNGQMVASLPEFRAVASSINDPLRIGGYYPKEGYLMDQVRIFNRALSVDEINSHYDADKAGSQYKQATGAGVKADASPNLLINTTFARCSNPGIPDWWGTVHAATIKNWEGTYGVDESMSPPVPGVKCLRIKNLGASKPFMFGSTFTCLPGKKDYTFSVYLKADTNGLAATIEGGTSSNKKGCWKAPAKFDLTTDWQRCVVSGYREDASVMGGLAISIVGKGTVWIAAPQLEFGGGATPYRPADMETATAEVGADADLPTVECVRTETPPVLDGTMDDACWKNAVKVGDFRRNERNNAPAQVKTDAWIACDATNLYVAFRCQEPEMNKLKATERKPGGAVYNDDSVEIFLATNPEANGYYHLGANSLGTRYSSFNRMSWNADWKCAVAKGRDAWTVEFAIPLASLDRSTPETPWRINLCRSRFAGKDPEFSSWSPLKCDSFHTPRRFAWLTGIQITPSAASTNQKKPDRPALQAMTEYDFYTSDPFATLVVDWTPDYPAELDVELKSTRPGKLLQPLAKRVRAPATSVSRIQVPLDKLADGLYEITVKALVEGKVVAAVNDHFSKLPPNPVEVRRNKPGRYLVVEGKPFLVYGVDFYLKWLRYDKSGAGENWIKNKLDPDNWQIDDIKAHGVNSMWTSDLIPDPLSDLDFQFAECKKFLDECQLKGVKVLFPVEIPTEVSYARHKELTLEMVRRFKDHPAVLAWSFVDEPDLWWSKSADRKEGDLLDLYRAIKAVDPYRPAFINWNFFGHPPFGALEASDMISVDRYPLHFSAFKFSPGIVADLADDINREARMVHQPTSFHLQLQGYWDMSREPTPAEARWMSYVNFIAGTRQLLYFTYKPMSAQLWGSMRPLGEELQKMFRLIATTDARELAGGKQGRLIYSLWKSEGKIYFMFANATTQPIVADLNASELTGKDVRNIEPLFESLDVRLSKNHLMLSLKPLQCGAYRLW